MLSLIIVILTMSIHQGYGINRTAKKENAMGKFAIIASIFCALLFSLGVYSVWPGVETCENSLACERFGKCTPYWGKCKVRSDDDCRGSIFCENEGKCNYKNGVCVAQSQKDCEKSFLCGHSAQCTLVKGRCALRRNQDCQMSSLCSVKGLCSVDKVAGSYWRSGIYWYWKCYARSNKDCEPSVVCKKRKECQALDGMCVE